MTSISNCPRSSKLATSFVRFIHVGRILFTSRGNSINVDYYKVLEVPVTANNKQIKAAYYRLSKVYHPDRFLHSEIKSNNVEQSDIYFSGQIQQEDSSEKPASDGSTPQTESVALTPEQAANKFRQLTEAYQILSDENKRKKYDYYWYKKTYSNFSVKPAAAWTTPSSKKDGAAFSEEESVEFDKINLEDIDDEVLRELLKYARYRKYRRDHEQRYHRWMQGRHFMRKDFKISDDFPRSSATMDDELYRYQSEYVKRRYEEERLKDKRGAWKSNASAEEAATEQPRNNKNVEWTDTDEKGGWLLHPLKFLSEYFRRKKHGIKTEVADKDTFHTNIMMYFIIASAIFGMALGGCRI